LGCRGVGGLGCGPVRDVLACIVRCNRCCGHEMVPGFGFADMGSDRRGGITQSGTSGSYTYASKSNMGVTAVETGLGSAGSTGNFANFESAAIWNSRIGNVTTVGGHCSDAATQIRFQREGSRSPSRAYSPRCFHVILIPPAPPPVGPVPRRRFIGDPLQLP
jgi:hypothetical protein